MRKWGSFLATWTWASHLTVGIMGMRLCHEDLGFLLGHRDEGFLPDHGDVGFSLCQGNKGVPLSHRELLNQIIFLRAFPGGAGTLQLSLWKGHQGQSITAVPTSAPTDPEQG